MEDLRAQGDTWNISEAWPFTEAILRSGREQTLTEAYHRALVELDRARAALVISRNHVALSGGSRDWPRELVFQIAPGLITAGETQTVEESLRKAIEILGSLPNEGCAVRVDGEDWTLFGGYGSVTVRRRS